ncbi:HpcH/HpaI aldolase/citrate lyase family protein [Cryptosporangium phraense]|uniref:CoA ester lyase n=1 Tax=Cryptosporangium phraense TaxID=2593070 RepID=A0A545AXF1_9ACTN|nr:CoA ester lyase [Cryptosporangium phraense]TQS45961.1 CoA ester lyase [Cryptosporangium phraense]
MWVPPGPAWLFCPADRPDRYAKAAAAADVVILDLEDAVAPADKDAARRALRDTTLDPERTVVRINSGDPADDLRALHATPYRRVMLPKAETTAEVLALRPYDVIVLLESARGVLAADDLAAAENTVGVMWGPEDLVASLGGNASRRPDGTFRDVARHARVTSLLVAKAHGRFALDTVHLDIADVDGLRAEAEDAVASGFDGTVAIHPSQVAVIRAAYTPPAEEVDWARRVLDAARGERGVFRFEGRMVDSPVLRHAEALLRRAGKP